MSIFDMKITKKIGQVSTTYYFPNNENKMNTDNLREQFREMLLNINLEEYNIPFMKDIFSEELYKRQKELSLNGYLQYRFYEHGIIMDYSGKIIEVKEHHSFKPLYDAMVLKRPDIFEDLLKRGYIETVYKDYECDDQRELLFDDDLYILRDQDFVELNFIQAILTNEDPVYLDLALKYGLDIRHKESENNTSNLSWSFDNFENEKIADYIFNSGKIVLNKNDIKYCLRCGIDMLKEFVEKCSYVRTIQDEDEGNYVNVLKLFISMKGSNKYKDKDIEMVRYLLNMGYPFEPEMSEKKILCETFMEEFEDEEGFREMMMINSELPLPEEVYPRSPRYPRRPYLSSPR